MDSKAPSYTIVGNGGFGLPPPFSRLRYSGKYTGKKQKNLTYLIKMRSV